MSDALAQTLVGARYRLDRCIGAGAMAVVYEATHVELAKRVAVKLLRPESAQDAEVLARFRREGRAGARIASEHVVPVLDAGHDARVGPFLVTELLAGEDLEARLAREGQLEPEMVAEIGAQIARGLVAAHAAGIVHRDIKPANVFLTTANEAAGGSLLAKIVDFGVSKIDEDGPDGPLTCKGMALGTPQYMAPEQLEGVLDLDGRADVWSLAAVLYECLTGAPPFADRGTYLDIMLAIARDRVDPVRARAAGVPESLASAIDAALERDRGARTPSAAAFAEKLQQAASRQRAWSRVRSSATMRRASVAPSAPTVRRRIK